jgi:hypothetical protein
VNSTLGIPEVVTCTIPLLNYNPGKRAGTVVNVECETVLDDYYVIDPAAAHPIATPSRGTNDRVNLVEMLMLSMNRGLNPVFMSCILWKLTDGRLTIALGRAPGINDLQAVLNFDDIASVEFKMNNQIALLFGFALRPNMKNTWFSPAETFNQVDGGAGRPSAFQNIPDERTGAGGFPFIYERGDMGVYYTEDAGNIWLMRAERPMKAMGPSILFIEVHTTGVKCRSLGHDSEKACWSLVVNNEDWCSARSNNGCRTCNAGTDLTKFYPDGLDYANVEQWTPNPTEHGSDTHSFSWIHPNWAYTNVPKASIQDLSFSVLNGDTQEPMNMFSGSGTQLSIVLSP